MPTSTWTAALRGMVQSKPPDMDSTRVTRGGIGWTNARLNLDHFPKIYRCQHHHRERVTFAHLLSGLGKAELNSSWVAAVSLNALARSVASAECWVSQRGMDRS